MHYGIRLRTCHLQFDTKWIAVFVLVFDSGIAALAKMLLVSIVTSRGVKTQRIQTRVDRRVESASTSASRT